MSEEMDLLDDLDDDKKEIYLDDDETKKVVHTKNSIQYCEATTTRNKEKTWRCKDVYRGHIKPIHRLIIDGNIYFKYVDITGKEQIADMTTIIKKVKQGGGVIKKCLLDNCLNAIFLGYNTVKGHATYGVYKVENKLIFCKNAYPINDLQIKVHKQVEQTDKEKILKETLEPYFKLLSFWHPYEILPCMGLSVMAPFALLLRKEDILVPHLWHYSQVSHLGKTTVQRIFSYHLYNIYPSSGDSINSSFRLATTLDSVCGFSTVDEAEDLKLAELEGILKESAESYVCSRRGTGNQTMNEYLSRSVLGITSNRFPITSESTLVRIIKVEFDSTKVNQRANPKNVEKLKDILSKLRPIGWLFIDLELDFVDYSLKKLIDKIGFHENKIQEHYSNFKDPRRATAYAVIYEGLIIWQRHFQLVGVDWKVPSYEEFVKTVVEIIEESTWETSESPLDDFLGWWAMWKVRHIHRPTMTSSDEHTVYLPEEPKGKGIIWDEKKLDYNGKSYTGEVITTPIVQTYQRDRKSRLDTLADIAKAVCHKTGIPKKKTFKSWNIGNKTKHGVFIPDDLIGDVSADIIGEHSTKLPSDDIKGKDDIEAIFGSDSENAASN